MKQNILPEIKWSEQKQVWWALWLRSDLVMALTQHSLLLLDKILPSSFCLIGLLYVKESKIDLFMIRSVTTPNYSTKVYHLLGSYLLRWLWCVLFWIWWSPIMADLLSKQNHQSSWRHLWNIEFFFSCCFFNDLPSFFWYYFGILVLV